MNRPLYVEERTTKHGTPTCYHERRHLVRHLSRYESTFPCINVITCVRTYTNPIQRRQPKKRNRDTEH